MLTALFQSLYTLVQKSDDQTIVSLEQTGRADYLHTAMSNSKTEKNARLKASLRANLRKRKERDRATAAPKPSLDSATPSPPKDGEDNA